MTSRRARAARRGQRRSTSKWRRRCCEKLGYAVDVVAQRPRSASTRLRREQLRPRADGLPDAGDGRLRGRRAQIREPRRRRIGRGALPIIALTANAIERRPRALPRRGHGRLPRQALQLRTARRPRRTLDGAGGNRVGCRPLIGIHERRGLTGPRLAGSTPANARKSAIRKFAATVARRQRGPQSRLRRQVRVRGRAWSRPMITSPTMRPPTGPRCSPSAGQLGLLEDVVPERRAAIQPDTVARQLAQVGARQRCTPIASAMLWPDGSCQVRWRSRFRCGSEVGGAPLGDRAERQVEQRRRDPRVDALVRPHLRRRAKSKNVCQPMKRRGARTPPRRSTGSPGPRRPDRRSSEERRRRCRRRRLARYDGRTSCARSGTRRPGTRPG